MLVIEQTMDDQMFQPQSQAFRPSPQSRLAGLSAEMMVSYVASVRADVVTEKTPEAVTYMEETGGSFADFVHDECFTCAILGKPFLYRDGVGTMSGWVHMDADFVAEAF